jgi:hypothetical protein
MSLLTILGMIATAPAEMKPIPKDKTTFAAQDWFPYTISKIAPLEWWTLVAHADEIVPKEYRSDYDYQRARKDLYHLPRFCFSLFLSAKSD